MSGANDWLRGWCIVFMRWLAALHRASSLTARRLFRRLTPRSRRGLTALGIHRHRALCGFQKQRRRPSRGRNDSEDDLQKGDGQELHRSCRRAARRSSSLVLRAILDNEKHVNLPGVREGSWFTSANYEMKLKPGGTQKVDGRDCVTLWRSRRGERRPILIDGTMWVDARTARSYRLRERRQELVGVDRTHADDAPVADIDGFAQATHARAESDSFLLARPS